MIDTSINMGVLLNKDLQSQIDQTLYIVQIAKSCIRPTHLWTALLLDKSLSFLDILKFGRQQQGFFHIF